MRISDWSSDVCSSDLHVLETLRAEGDARPWAVVATAHPAKFEVVIEPLVGRAIALPPSLEECLSRSTAATFLPPGYDILRACLVSPHCRPTAGRMRAMMTITIFGPRSPPIDRKSAVQGKVVSVRVYPDGRQP